MLGSIAVFLVAGYHMFSHFCDATINIVVPWSPKRQSHPSALSYCSHANHCIVVALRCKNKTNESRAYEDRARRMET